MKTNKTSTDNSVRINRRSIWIRVKKKVALGAANDEVSKERRSENESERSSDKKDSDSSDDEE